METTKQNRSNVHETSVEDKAFKQNEEIASPSKIFCSAPFSYFSGTCVSRRFYSNLISKSRSHLIFTVTLSFYVLFLGLIFRSYLLSSELNHGLSGENIAFLKIS